MGVLEQIDELPDIAPGVAGAVVETETITEVDGLVPQEFEAETEIFPPVEPAEVEIELVVELPLHPPGRVQVYELAAGSELTE